MSPNTPPWGPPKCKEAGTQKDSNLFTLLFDYAYSMIIIFLVAVYSAVSTV